MDFNYSVKIFCQLLWVLSPTIFGTSGFFPKDTILFSNASVFEREGIEFFKGLSLSHLIFFHLKQILERTYRKITFMVTNIWKLRALERLQRVKEEKNPPQFIKYRFVEATKSTKVHNSHLDLILKSCMWLLFMKKYIEPIKTTICQ